MNRQTFTEYLEQPSKLYQLSLTELQGLVLEYPYSANLRLLLLIKARLENHPRAEEMLHQAAARTFNRAHLYDMLRQLEREGLEGLTDQDDRLELQDLDRLEFEFLPNEQLKPATAASSLGLESDFEPILPTDPSPPEAVAAEDDTETSPPEAPLELPADPAPEVVPTPPVTIERPEPSAAFELPAELIAIAATIGEITRNFAATPPAPTPEPEPEPVPAPAPPVPPAPTPTPKVESGLAARMRRHRERQIRELTEDPVKREEKLKEKARRSLRPHREVASETLAELLVKQGQLNKAIKMYKRLSLLYPEKKATFAGLIKELKEKL